MSTTFFSLLTKDVTTFNGKCSKQTGVQAEQESFADYLRRVINEKGLKYRQVAERSGGQISHAAISGIISGKTIHVKASTIEALAQGLDVPAEEVFAAYRGKSPNDDPEFEKSEIAALFYDYKELTPKDQEQLRAIWDMLRAEIKRRKIKPKKD